MSDDDERLRDLGLARWLLLGRHPDDATPPALIEPGGPVVPDYKPDYPADGSEDDKQARDAVVRLLLDRSDDIDARTIRYILSHMLAMLFDPDERGGKRLVLEYRKQGTPTKAPRNEAICFEIESLKRSTGSYNKAYEVVATKRGLTAATIKDIFLDWRRAGRTTKL